MCQADQTIKGEPVSPSALQSGDGGSIKKILVCGGRDFKDKDLLNTVLDHICFTRGWRTEVHEDGNWLPSVKVISGAASGADKLAINWATMSFCPSAEYPAEWDKHGKRAGPLRNHRMLTAENPDLVVAFPGGAGTLDMIRQATRANVEVIRGLPYYQELISSIEGQRSCDEVEPEN